MGVTFPVVKYTLSHLELVESLCKLTVPRGTHHTLNDDSYFKEQVYLVC